MDALPIISQLKSLILVSCGDVKGAETTQINFSRQCPVVSQIRSAVEASLGDVKGAEKTQIIFSRQCPVVSQIRSAVEASLGDCKAAEETQKEFLLGMVEGIPGVGHAIGEGYYASGQSKWMDALPIISQLKSLILVSCGDVKGAETTQINFSRQCPVVSQIRSAVEASLGDCKAAEETQRECGGILLGMVEGTLGVGHAIGEGFILGMVKGTLGVGHAIGAGFYTAGRKDWGDFVMKTASLTTVVIGGGALGFIVGGPIGAMVGGTSGGMSMVVMYRYQHFDLAGAGSK